MGNRLLADWAKQHTSKVDAVPSTIDLARYPTKPPEQAAKPVTLGWTGSHSTLPFLAMLHDTLNRLAATHEFRLLVISHRDDYPLDSAPFEVVAKRWNSTTEATDLHEIDIGLGPFPNSGWTPWRCHGKVLQYMAVGIPCVTSPIGILPEYVRDGENGLLAADPSQWLEKLSLLINNADLRRRIGLAGRDTIEQRYSVDAWLPKIRQILESAVDTRPPRNRKRPRLSQSERAPVPLEPNRGTKCRC
ncbi:MAG: hypothetical protein A2V70_04515 [Planctomycetes bacterium RBG_13_63_9]|nr:MAG: hypothetical protein A2V70_04515 [Planctomycetes bacterium RBG_13_63_9]